MTMDVSAEPRDLNHGLLTLVDKLKLRNDVKADLRELILEHLKEHGQKMIDSPRVSSQNRTNVAASGVLPP